MPLFFSPVGNSQTVDANGDPLSGGQIETYIAGSSTPAATYTDDSGGTPQANPIILNSLGWPANPIWLTGGQAYKFIIKDSLGVTLRTIDDISGVNDASVSQSEWVNSGLTPTYIDATSFSVPGDQTANLQIGRRLRTTNTSGFIYSTISNSVFAAGITTVTVVNDSGTLDAGLTIVEYGLLAASPLSVPNLPGSKITGLVTDSSLTMSANRVLGRSTAATGDVEELTPAGALEISGGNLTAIIPRGFIAGLTMSTAGSSTTMSIAAGMAADSTNAVFLSLASAISKTTSAWAVGTGNGGLDTGSIATSTWYHFYLIRRPDTGVVDVVFSLSASSPTLPTNYTQYRRIGSGRTNGSSQWTSFVQDGDLFQWASPTLDIDVTNPGTSAVSRQLLVPTGVRVGAIFNYGAYDPTNANQVGAYFSDLSTTDLAASATAAPLITSASAGTNNNGGYAKLEIMTNTSAQVRSRMTFSGSTSVLKMATLGWRDSRGRDA